MIKDNFGVPIRCAHPQIIVNPNLVNILMSSRCFVLNGCTTIADDSWFEPTWQNGVCRYSKFPYHYFSNIKKSLDINDLDRCYIVERNTAKHIPIFYAVPCQKCSLCREKKSIDWQCRIEAETVMNSSALPLFILLTYKDSCLPADGVSKTDVQLFFKRLRKWFDDRGIKHNLRYFLVAEYGSKKGRPHYHIILWNWNFGFDMVKTKRLIKRAWKTRRRKGYRETSLGFVYVQVAGAKKQKDGFVDISLQGSSKGCAKYCAKYMRKKQLVPDGKNPVFFTSSRGNGGIGSSYLRSRMDFFRDNIHYSRIVLTNPHCHQRSTFSMPAYWRAAVCPTLSRIVPKNIRDIYFEFCELVLMRYSLISERTYNVLTPDKEFSDVFDKFRYLPRAYSLNCCKFFHTNVRYDDMDKDYFKILDDEIKWRYEILMDFPLSADEVLKLLSYKRKFTDYINTLPKKSYDVDSLEHIALERENRQFLKEDDNL